MTIPAIAFGIFLLACGGNPASDPKPASAAAPTPPPLPAAPGAAPGAPGSGPGAPVPGIGTGGTRAAAYVPVTGGGPFPRTDDALVLDCAGNGIADDTGCFQAAIRAAAAAGKALLVPYKDSHATTGAYRITSPLIVTTSLIGIGAGQPRIKQDSRDVSWQRGATLLLHDGFSGWIYNLHLVGNRDVTGRNGEWAHNIGLKAVNGVTIRGNRLESTRGDGISDNPTDLSSGSATNVWVDNNTIVATWRCALSLTGKADRWLVTNNRVDYSNSDYSFQGSRTTPILFEPEGRFDAFIRNVEVAYNEITYPVKPRSPVTRVVAMTAWHDPTPGGSIFVHHNYGHWGPPFIGFDGPPYSHKGQGRIYFDKVVQHDNVAGTVEPP